MTVIVGGASLFLAGSAASLVLGAVPSHGALAEFVWLTMAMAGIVTILGAEASN